MSKLVKTNFPYGMVPNSLLNSNKISLKAKGLFAYMQSKPDQWSFSVEKIAYQCKESKSSISEGLKELEKLGFLERKKQQTNAGFVVDYHLYFKAIAKKPITDFQSLETQPLESQSLETQLLENPIIGKSANNSNKELSNKDNSNKERESAFSFFQKNSPSEYENFMMRFRSKFSEIEFEKFTELFDCKFIEEQKEYTTGIISARLTRFAINYCSNIVAAEKKDKVFSLSNEVPLNHPSRKKLG
jgi:DNA-binding MarR family transcriptional regulator